MIGTSLIFDAEGGDTDLLSVEDHVRNLTCVELFHYWERMYLNRAPEFPPIHDPVRKLNLGQRPNKISSSNLDSKKLDFQGITWSNIRATQEDAREIRRRTYRNHTNVERQYGPRINSHGPFGRSAFKAKFNTGRAAKVPKTNHYFHFQETNTRCTTSIPHFQLRHNISASSKNAIFYNEKCSSQSTDRSKIMCANTHMGTNECAMDFTKASDRDAPRLDTVTTLTASDGLLIAGGFNGIYALKSLSSTFETEFTTGIVSAADLASTNHVSTFLDRRSGLAQAVFDSNDKFIRVLDCQTGVFVRAHEYEYHVNCSATSPDGRLRLLVGDDCWPIVANAETGETIAKLPGHRDFGFTCAWAPDGITLATGHQDGLVQVWDARNLTESIHIIPMEMGGCRAMQFSPVGSGKRVLALAEPADFVHVVDAESFQSQQEIEFFGEIAGISMPPDGSKLYIANWDPDVGGLMEYDRHWNSSRYGSRGRPPSVFRDIGQEISLSEDQDEDDHSSEDGMTGIDYDDTMAATQQGNTWGFSSIRKAGTSNTKVPVDWLPESDLEDDLTQARRQRSSFGVEKFFF